MLTGSFTGSIKVVPFYQCVLGKFKTKSKKPQDWVKYIKVVVASKFFQLGDEWSQGSWVLLVDDATMN